MVSVTIQNFSIDATNILGIIDFENAEIAGPPTVTDTFIAASFTDGRHVELFGAFEPAVDAFATLDIEILLARIDELRLDAMSATINGQAYLDIDLIDLHGVDVAAFIDSVDVEGAVAYVFSADDTIVSGVGDDTLRGYAGDDIVLGMDGSDYIEGDSGDDDVNGNRGEDLVGGGEGRDFVRGGQQNDIVYGDDGDDWHVNGNNNNDLVYGGEGNDSVYGGRDDDFLFGENGDDDVSGDLGNDTLSGGFGADYFIFRSNSGADLIEDFFPVEDGDKIALTGTGINSGAAALAATTDSPNGAVVNLGGGNSVTILGFQKSELFESDFVIF